MDAEGNALGGIRHPLLAAPLATHVGWSLRASGYGEGELFTVQGSMIPFAQTEAESAGPRSAGLPSKRAMDRAMPGLRGWPRPWIYWSPSGCCWPRMATG